MNILVIGDDSVFNTSLSIKMNDSQTKAILTRTTTTKNNGEGTKNGQVYEKKISEFILKKEFNVNSGLIKLNFYGVFQPIYTRTID